MGRRFSVIRSNGKVSGNVQQMTQQRGYLKMNLQTIKLSEIVTNPNQPRKYFDEQAITELSESIKNDGLMQPITVRKVSRDTIQ